MTIKPEHKQAFFRALVAFVTVLFSIAGSVAVDYLTAIGDIPPEDSIIALGTTNFTDIEAEDVTVTDDLTVTDDTTLSGLLLPGFADETITNGEVLTPTVTVYALDSAGAVTMTLAAAGTEGQLLILIGDDANNITIADTNLRSHDGAALVLGQYDIAFLVYQDSEWIQLVELATS